MSKVPNCRFRGTYRIDLLGLPSFNLSQSPVENHREINGQIPKTA